MTHTTFQYNKLLRYRCAGCINNDNKCNDNNVSFVNSKIKQAHFRHSKNTECSASKTFKEFNIDFYKNWFHLFKREYRKPYWFNYNLEEIKYENIIIMIRYNHQSEKKIKHIETYVKEENKIIWILSLENRKYDKIIFYKGKIYIDFIGNKNDIPLYDNNKSIIYLDTGFDILFLIKLESYNNKGQEIEIINIKDFCKNYDELFISNPYRKKCNYIDNILNEKKIYDNTIIKLKQKYNEYEEKLKTTKYITETLISLFDIYNKLKDLNYNIIFNYEDEYNICTYKISNVVEKIEKLKKEINLDKYITLLNNNNLNYYLSNNSIDIKIYEDINNIKKLYNKLFNYKKSINNKFNTFNYIENRDWYIFEKKNKEYNFIIELEKNINEYIYNIFYINQYNYNIYILNEYENICYNYLDIQFKEEQKRKEEEYRKKLIKKQIEKAKKRKEKEEREKKEIELEIYNQKLIIQKKYKIYENDEFLNNLLEIIKNNYEKIKNIKDDYLHKYYVFITHHLNYDVNKMIKYITYMEKYLI